MMVMVVVAAMVVGHMIIIQVMDNIMVVLVSRQIRLPLVQAFMDGTLK